MLAEAEKFKDEDKKHADRAAAKSSLESYAFSLRSTLSDEKVAGKIEKEDKEKLEKLVKATIDWVTENENADKDEYESKKSELESQAGPIISKIYQGAGGGAGGGGGMPGGFDPSQFGGGGGGGGDDAPPSGPSKKGPKIEEVD